MKSSILYGYPKYFLTELKDLVLVIGTKFLLSTVFSRVRYFVSLSSTHKAISVVVAINSAYKFNFVF